MRRFLVLLALLVVGLVGLVPLGAAPAFACSCAWNEVQQYVDSADHVVVGRLQDQQYGRGGGADGDGLLSHNVQTARYTVDGERVLKGGELASPFEVVSAASGAACGLEGMVVDRRYVFFLQRDEGTLSASLCGGTGPATPSFVAEVEALTGTGGSAGGVPLRAGTVAELRAALSGLTLWP